MKSIWRTISGKVIEQRDIAVMDGHCVLSLRLKTDSKHQGAYVVLAAKSLGNHQYYPLDADEFSRFVDAAIEIRDALKTGD